MAERDLGRCSTIAGSSREHAMSRRRRRRRPVSARPRLGGSSGWLFVLATEDAASQLLWLCGCGGVRSAQTAVRRLRVFHNSTVARVVTGQGGAVVRVCFTTPPPYASSRGGPARNGGAVCGDPVACALQQRSGSFTSTAGKGIDPVACAHGRSLCYSRGCVWAGAFSVFCSGEFEWAFAVCCSGDSGVSVSGS